MFFDVFHRNKHLINIHSCRVKIDMTGNGIAGLPEAPQPPSSTGTFRPYRTGIQEGLIDMDAFVNDLKIFWPGSTPASSSAAAAPKLGAGGWILAACIALAITMVSGAA